MELLIASMLLSNVLVADPSVYNAPIEAIVPETSIEERITAIDPIMLEIARCESHMRQFNDDGTVLQGAIDPDDSGIFQINKYYHLQAALQMGIDIDSVQGNIAYARYLFEKNGTQPWSASQFCWRKPLLLTTVDN